MIGSTLTFALPFTSNIGTYLLCIFVYHFVLSSFACMNQAAIVQTLGPVTSRPFTMGLHLSVGFGFLGGSLLVRPFLPDDMHEEGDTRGYQDVCVGGSDANSTSTLHEVVPLMAGLPSIYWPFIIISCLVWASSLMLLPLAFCFKESTLKMPIYEGENETEEDGAKEDYKKACDLRDLIQEKKALKRA